MKYTNYAASSLTARKCKRSGRGKPRMHLCGRPCTSQRRKCSASASLQNQREKKVSQTELNFELIGMPWYPRTALGVRGRRTTDGVDGGQRPDHLCFTPARWTLPPDSPPPSQVRPRGGEPGGSRPVLPRRQSSEQRERDGRKRQWSFLPSVEVGQKYSK
jgi:hypothetical protein